MMRKLALLLACCPAALMAEDIPLTSDVTAVTLYPHGATIVRDVLFNAPAGDHHLILTDLPIGTELEKVRVKVIGARMGSVTTRRDFVPPRTEKEDAALEAAKARVEQAEDELRVAQSAVRQIRLEQDAASARVAFLRGLGEGDNVAELGVDALRDLAGMIGEETLAALSAAHEAEQRADVAQRDLKDLEEALDKARRALQALVPEDKERAMLAIAINAEGQTDGRIEISYVSEEAYWLPVYDLKLDRANAQLSIERGAIVEQATGEHWDDVALTLSTVRPSEQTEPGTVWPWLRRIYEPQPQLAKTLMRDQAGVMVEALEEPVMGQPYIEVAVPVADFDGLAVSYEYPSAVSVASGADAVRLSLGTLQADVELTARAVPLTDSSAFLMAGFTNDTDELILPTDQAMAYIDGRFVGQRYLELVPAGDKTEISFGPIDGLRLKRTVLDRNEGDRGFISKSNGLREDVQIEVENLTGETWPVVLHDHVPYSEQEDLEVTWSAQPQPSERDVEGKRGVLAWSFDLGAGQSHMITLSHSLEWPDGMKLQ